MEPAFCHRGLFVRSRGSGWGGAFPGSSPGGATTTTPGRAARGRLQISGSIDYRTDAEAGVDLWADGSTVAWAPAGLANKAQASSC